MLTHHIALVPEGEGVRASELAWVSAALQTQVLRDFAPIWGVTATVDPFPSLEDVPLGYWPIIVCLRPLGSQAGVHVDRNGQPYARIEGSAEWSLHASRACLEMLINPAESHLIIGSSPRADRAPAEFLVQVCSACDLAAGAYPIHEVQVTDFCLPAYFGACPTRGEGYSFNASIDAPFQVMRGGHIAWHDPLTDHWWLRSHWGMHPIDTRLGVFDKKHVSVREFVQACASLRAPLRATPEARLQARALHAEASQLHGRRMRALPEIRLESELEAAFNVLQLRHDPADRREPAMGVFRTPAPSAPPRGSDVFEWRRESYAREAQLEQPTADDEFDVSDVLEDDLRPEPAAAPPEPLVAQTARSTIRPPLPPSPSQPASPDPAANASTHEAPELIPTASVPRATPVPAYPSSGNNSPSLSPVVWTVPPQKFADGQRRHLRSGLLIASGAAAGVLIALAWQTGPALRSRAAISRPAAIEASQPPAPAQLALRPLEAPRAEVANEPALAKAAPNAAAEDGVSIERRLAIASQAPQPQANAEPAAATASATAARPRRSESASSEHRHEHAGRVAEAAKPSAPPAPESDREIAAAPPAREPKAAAPSEEHDPIEALIDTRR